jgi:catecholate siderophore receptor
MRMVTALATMAAYGAAGAVAQAKPQSAAVDPRQATRQMATLLPAEQPVVRFHVAAGGLGAALDAFQQQSGLRLEMLVPPSTLTALQSAGVAGLYTNEVALRILLEGTGLSVRSVAPGVFAVKLEDRQTVNVAAGVLPDAVGMGKFTEPLLDTPQTIEVVPNFVLQDQQNRTLMDAVRNVPGISLAAGESGAQGDNLTIRGFTARNDIYLDGIRDFGSYYRDSFNFEQVDVLEGPAGVQFGRGSTGGVINQESKQPELERFLNVETQVGTDLTRRVTADINEPMADWPGGGALRVNLMANDGGVAGRPYAEVRRFGAAPEVSIGMNTPTTATLDYFHLTESDTPDYGLPWFQNGVAHGAGRHSYYGFADENYLRTSDDVLTLKANHRFDANGDTNLHTLARWANYPRDVQITEPQICANVSVSTPVGGYVSALPKSALNSNLTCTYTPSTPANQITVNRNQIQIKSVEGDLWDQTELQSRLKVAGVRNELVVGVEGGQEISNPIRYSYTENGINSVTPTNLADPTPQDVFSGTGYISSITHVKSKSAGVYFVDTVHLGRFVELSGGVRWDYFNTLYNLYAPATAVSGAKLSANIAPIDQTVRQPSYRAAIVYKPNQHGSIYFDWGTSFNPSAETLSLSVATSVLPPEENESYEAGAKYSLLGDRVHAEAAVFQTEQDNARETSPTNSNLIVEAGNQRVRGVQASTVGDLGGGTSLVLGYAYMHSEVIASQIFPTSIGFPLANVPKQTFNAYLTHNLPWRINFGLGGNYVAARTASSTVPYVPTSYSTAQTFSSNSPCGASTCYQVLSVAMKQVPGYWDFSLMVKKQVTQRLELQANIYNLLNRFYIDQPHPSHLIPGAGASALFGANWRF